MPRQALPGTYLDGEDRRVDELGHLGKNTLVPVFQQRGVARRRWVHRKVWGVRPQSADYVGLVEHVLISARATPGEGRHESDR